MSPSLYTQPTRWNLFARELEDVLSAHQLRLGQLDDLGVVEHREKVRRLQQSLRSPAHFPTLNPDEIDRLIKIVHLTELEQTRIRAALLATAVERILMDRIDAQIAFMAASDVFTILLAAMRAQPNSALIGVREGIPIDDPEPTGDASYEEALDLVDRATLTLHLSQQATSIATQHSNAQDALDDFTRALTLLQQAHLPQHVSDEWRAWDQEARHGCEMAKSLLDLNDG